MGTGSKGGKTAAQTALGTGLVVLASAAIVGLFCVGPAVALRRWNRPHPPTPMEAREWPPLFRSVVDAAGLTSDERRRVSVVRRQEGFGDYVCLLRMPAARPAVEKLKAELAPVPLKELEQSVWEHGVTRNEFGPAATLDVYRSQTRAVESSEEYIAFHDRQTKRLVVIYRWVF